MAGPDFATDEIGARANEALYLAMGRHDQRILIELMHGIDGCDVTPLFQEIQVPCLIVGGEVDPIISIDETRHVAQVIPGSELVVLPNTGHIFHAERREEVLRLIQEWVTRHSHQK